MIRLGLKAQACLTFLPFVRPAGLHRNDAVSSRRLEGEGDKGQTSVTKTNQAFCDFTYVVINSDIALGSNTIDTY